MATKSDAPVLLKGATLTRGRQRGATEYPALAFRGEVPAKGAKVRVEIDGVLYEATVFDAQVVAETSGLTPVVEDIVEPPAA